MQGQGQGQPTETDASGADVAQPASRPSPLTLLMPIRPRLAGLTRRRLRLGLGPWLLARYELRRLTRLGFLHTGRWQVVDGFPFCGPPQRPERDRCRYLLFASDYDGHFDSYIDSFSDVLALRLDTLWCWCRGYPRAAPAGPFKRYIRHWQLTEGHYYSAAPNAPAKVIDQALELAQAWREFDAGWGQPEVPAAAFQAAFRRFVADNQARL